MIRLGLSANTPPCDPNAYPERASFCGQFGTTSYGPVSSSPPFCWSPAAPHNRPLANTTATTSVSLRITFLLFLASHHAVTTALLLVEDLYVINRLALHIDALLRSSQRLP